MTRRRRRVLIKSAKHRIADCTCRRISGIGDIDCHIHHRTVRQHGIAVGQIDPGRGVAAALVHAIAKLHIAVIGTGNHDARCLRRMRELIDE